MSLRKEGKNILHCNSNSLCNREDKAEILKLLLICSFFLNIPMAHIFFLLNIKKTFSFFIPRLEEPFETRVNISCKSQQKSKWLISKAVALHI